jgi:hypothetical protein
MITKEAIPPNVCFVEENDKSMQRDTIGRDI